MEKRKILLIAGAAIMAAFLYSYSHGTLLDGKYAPIPNPHPRYVVHISGTMTPPLSIRTIEITYMATTPACQLDGPAVLFKTYKVSIFVQETATRYEATAALDHITPGLCGWLPYSIDFYPMKSDGTRDPHAVSVWVHTPGIVGGMFAQQGMDVPPPLEIKCQLSPFKDDGHPALLCLPSRGDHNITINARELPVNFSEGIWSGM